MSRRVSYAEHGEGFCEVHGEGSGVLWSSTARPGAPRRARRALFQSGAHLEVEPGPRRVS